MGQRVIRPIHARKGEIVRIIWHHDTLEPLTEMHTAPPDDVWKSRLQQSAVVRELKQAENPPDRIDT